MVTSSMEQTSNPIDKLARYDIGACDSMFSPSGAYVKYRDAVEAISAVTAPELPGELTKLREEALWVRRKLGLAASTPFVSGGGYTLAGRLHVLCAHSDSFELYVSTYKCDDKQGAIARLSRELAQAQQPLPCAVSNHDLIELLKRGVEGWTTADLREAIDIVKVATGQDLSALAEGIDA
jgi:hypothetical protein